MYEIICINLGFKVPKNKLVEVQSIFDGHNFANNQEKIDNLMHSNDYVRVFKKITAFDAWYVFKEAFDRVKK